MGEKALARRSGDALSQIVGTGDTQAALDQVERNVNTIIEVARRRGFVTRFELQNKRTGETKITEFYGFPAWHLLAMTYGVTPVVEWTKPVDGGYAARAVAQTRDGQIVGAAEAVCLRREPRREQMPDHSLLALAQTRAMRNALRSAFASALVLAGFDVPNPEAPATREQVGLLHQLERELGWSHEEGHRMAGVGSYTELTREQAAETIELWKELLEMKASDGPLGSGPEDQAEGEPAQADARHGEGRRPSKAGPPPPEPAEPEEDVPATPEQWDRALRLHGSKVKILRMVRERYPEVTKASEITRRQLAEVMFG
jgi:hypothetical protein